MYNNYFQEYKNDFNLFKTNLYQQIKSFMYII